MPDHPMADSPVFWLKIRAARDRKLSDGAFRLLSLLVDTRADVRKFPDDEFTLTWREIHGWTGWSENTVYRYVGELARREYLVKRGLRGSPPKTVFLLGSKSPKFGGFESPKNGAFDSPKNGASLKSNPYGKKVREKKEGTGAGTAAADAAEDGGRRRSVAELGAALREALGE